MVGFRDYIRYIYPLLEQGYIVETLNTRRTEKHDTHDLARYFDLIAVREGDVRLIRIMGGRMRTDILAEIRAEVHFNEPSVEVWLVRGENRKIYRLINGDFYRMEYDLNYFDCRDAKEVMKFRLWGEEGILVLGGYYAYFIKDKELYDHFDMDIKPYLSKTVRVVYQNNKLTFVRKEED
jgi:hypothetical protein